MLALYGALDNASAMSITGRAAETTRAMRDLGKVFEWEVYNRALPFPSLKNLQLEKRPGKLDNKGLRLSVAEGARPARGAAVNCAEELWEELER